VDQVGGDRRLALVCLCSNLKGPPTEKTMGGEERGPSSAWVLAVTAEERSDLVDQRFGGSIIPRVVLRGKWSEYDCQDR